MRESRRFRSKLATLVKVGAVAVCVAASAALIGETQAVAQSGGGPGNGGGPGFDFSDNFETPGTWSAYSTSSSGVSYVSSRPADAQSPTHLGDEYDRRGAAPGYQMLARAFTLPTNAGACSAVVYIKPLTAVTGELQILDPANKNRLATTPFTFPGGSGWRSVVAIASAAASANVISIRVVLNHNGTWQEFLVDDLYGSCPLVP